MKNLPPRKILLFLGGICCVLLLLPNIVGIDYYKLSPLRDSTSAAGLEGFPESTMSAIFRDIAQREYHIRFDSKEGKYQSPNRKHNIRTYYAPGRWEMQSREAIKKNNWELAFSTIGVFADGTSFANPVQNPTVTVVRNQIEFAHKKFIEQYVNSEEGVRQNFIILEAPENARELSVQLKIHGMKGFQKKNGEIQFLDGMQQLDYAELKAWDATGKLLKAFMEIDQGGMNLLLKVLVDQVTFPITIDPIVSNGNPTNADTFLEENQASSFFGFAVSAAGDVNGDGYGDIIVGASRYDNGETDEGAAFVYHGSATGIGTVAATLLEVNQASANFGNNVSNAGDVNGDGFGDVVVGANLYDNGETNEGAAFVFHGSSTGLGTTPITVLESNQTDAQFGYSVSTAGDVNADGFSDLIIGAWNYDNGQSDEGAAFVFHGSAGGISTTANVILESNQASARMGVAASSAGDVNGDGFGDVIVGAHFYDNGQTNEGIAFVYLGSMTGINSTPNASLESNQSSAFSGQTVSNAGDVNGDGYSDVIIGARFYDNGESQEGAAFVHHGGPGGVSSTVAAQLESDQIGGELGISVSGAGDVNGDGYADVIVGAWGFQNGETQEGAAFIYHGSAGGLSTVAESTIESDQASARLGISVSGAGDVNGDGYSDVIAGSWFYSNGETSEGAAFVFHGSASGLSTTVTNSLEGNQASANFGFSVSSAGDVNGDGFGDIIVGAPYFDNGQLDEGVAFVYHGSVNGLGGTAAATLEEDQVGSEFGYSVSGAGDVNGDGYSDVIVGARSYDNGETDEGAVFVYHGSSGGLSSVAAVTLEADQGSAFLGYSVASAGDVNGDGFGDIIIGAPFFDNGETNEGVAFIHHGASGGINSMATITLEANQENASYGWSVAGAGDVNGDGYGDVVIGIRSYTNGESGEGAAAVYHGSSSGVNGIAIATVESNQASAAMGSSVSTAGDVNGDGFSDVIIGANGFDNGESNEGAAFVFHGSSSGITTPASSTLESNVSDAAFGASVSSAGDVNGDGYSDVLVGAYEYTNTEFNEGAAFVFHGSESGLATTAAFLVESDQIFAQMGWGVSGAGDVNGDGFSDVIVGVRTYDNGQNDEGAAFIYQGNEGGGLQRNMQLYNTATTTPIQQSNFSSTDFALGLFARNPQGRTNAKLVWETKTNGQGFEGNPISNSTASSGEQSSFTDLGISGVELSENIDKAGGQTKVRARIMYDPVTSQNGQVFGPWIYPSALFESQGMNATPLPIELLFFKVTRENDVALIKWETVSETNNDYFTIERSLDGLFWEEWRIEDGAGNSSSSVKYLVKDFAPLPGVSFYRLKQTDFDGRFSYSNIELFQNEFFSEDEDLTAYPNPATDKITLTGLSEGAEINMVNLRGQDFSTHMDISYREKQAIINLARLPKGIYFLRSGTQTAKFVKQ